MHRRLISVVLVDQRPAPLDERQIEAGHGVG